MPPTLRRPKPLSYLTGALAMCCSLTVLGSLVVSDIAAAETPPPLPASERPVAAKPVEVATTRRVAEASPTPGSIEEELLQKPEPVKQKKKRKKRVDFGRYEGY